MSDLVTLSATLIAGEPVVDSPACIVDFRSLAALRPPSVTFRDIAVNVTEGVSKSSCRAGEASDVLVCKIQVNGGCWQDLVQGRFLWATL